MPVEFLSDEQVAAYGRFAGPPSRAQLERFFFLNDADRQRIDRRRPGPRRDSHRLGFAVQLGTVRFLGAFLPDPLAVPRAVVAYVAGQLGIAEPGCLAAYPERAMTPYEHAWEQDLLLEQPRRGAVEQRQRPLGRRPGPSGR